MEEARPGEERESGEGRDHIFSSFSIFFPNWLRQAYRHFLARMGAFVSFPRFPSTGCQGRAQAIRVLNKTPHTATKTQARWFLKTVLLSLAHNRESLLDGAWEKVSGLSNSSSAL